MKIAFRYWDNDFQATYTCVMEIILDIYNRHQKEFTKSSLKDIINGLAYPMYMCFQTSSLNGNSPTIQKYLKDRIQEKHIYFDDEVDKYVEECKGWDNYEFVILDTDLNYENNNPIYVI